MKRREPKTDPTGQARNSEALGRARSDGRDPRTKGQTAVPVPRREVDATPRDDARQRARRTRTGASPEQVQVEAERDGHAVETVAPAGGKAASTVRTADPWSLTEPAVEAPLGLGEVAQPSPGVGAARWLDRWVAPGLPIRWELALYALLLLIGAAMHFWDLGSRALHHDESLHAVYSWYLYVGRGYRHDPMMHGPFQFHLTALIYFLFGATDYTARVLPAIAGTLLIGVPYFFRGFLGRYGALLASVLLTISPSILFYGRFARNDVYIALFNLILVVAIWRYLATPRPIYLYISALMLSLGFLTKEVTFITAAVFGGFFLLATLRQWPGILRHGLAALRRVSPTQDVLLLIGLLALPQFSAVIQIPLKVFKINLDQPFSNVAGVPLTVETGIGVVTVSAVIALTVAIGVAWKGSIWWRIFACFYVPYALLYSTFLSNPPGLGSGIWGSLDYWLAQHDVQRGNQPIYYYLVILPIYEFLPIVLSTGAMVTYLFRRRSLFTTFLIFWFVGSLLLYSWAGEKMPWLTVHMALPLIILGCRYYGEVLDRLSWDDMKLRGGWLLLGLVPLTLVALAVVLRGNTGQPRSAIEVIALALVVAALVGLTWQIASGLSARSALRIVGLSLVIILIGFTIRAAWQASYYNGDTPVEMLVYTQSSPAIPRIMRDIEEIGRRTGEGKNLKITVDSTESFTWPWAWYLRDYPNVDYPALSAMTGPPRGQVLLLHASNEGRARPFLSQYLPGQRYPHRWWFPEETYRNLDLGKFLGLVVQPSTWDKWWTYVFKRDPGQKLGSTDAIAYYPKEAGTLAAVPPPITPQVDLSSKQVDVQPTLLTGGPGVAPGQFQEPKAIAVGPNGDFYVVDSGNARIQRFNAQGQPITSWGGRGNGPGQFAVEFGGAWGITVDPSGNVVVVDTWNHRIQKFSSDGQLLTTVGGALTDNQGQAQGNEARFYGPRGIAVDREGNWYVTDTGNHRVQKLSGDGKFLGAFGGRGVDVGTFNEPVGIAVDQEGNIYVADTWNHRIQKFAPTFAPIAQYPVPGWEGESLQNKPALAVDGKGNVIASDPEGGRLFRFNPQGQLLQVIGKFGPEPGSLNLPMGVAFDGQENLYVVEAGNGRVQRFAGAAISAVPPPRPPAASGGG